MADINYYRHLLQQYLNDELKDEQVRELFDYLQYYHKAAKSLLEEYSKSAFEQQLNYPRPVPESTKTRMLQHLLREIKEKEEKPVIPIHRVHFIKRIGWVAASVIIVACTTYFFTFRSQNKNPVVKTTTVLLPGSNKAVLTLANGATINLDTTQQGIVASQNGVQIKANKGLLTYSGSAANAAPSINTITTPRGGQFRLLLPDGSKIWLNASSSITYPTAFTGKERSVSITGEVYFEVVHNAAMPFKVKTASETIEDLGTHFNVMAYDDEPAIRVTLFEGGLKLTTPGNETGTIIQPGQQASLAKDGSHFNISHPNLYNILGWQQGEFRFEHASIAEIMRQVGRWYDADIHFQNKDTQYTFSGNISKQKSVNDLLDILSASGDVHFEVAGKNITVVQGAARNESG